jgi:hypothetical protein
MCEVCLNLSCVSGTYRHNEGDQDQGANLRQPTICQPLTADMCCYGDESTFMHNPNRNRKVGFLICRATQ